LFTISLLAFGENLFPPELAFKVPEAIFDSREAGACLAFELPTACGFHVFRATESVLRKYYLQVTRSAVAPKVRNIGVYLNAMKQKKVGDEKITYTKAFLDSKNVDKTDYCARGRKLFIGMYLETNPNEPYPYDFSGPRNPNDPPQPAEPPNNPLRQPADDLVGLAHNVARFHSFILLCPVNPTDAAGSASVEIVHRARLLMKQFHADAWDEAKSAPKEEYCARGREYFSGLFVPVPPRQGPGR
jgi:hypothetical protein